MSETPGTNPSTGPENPSAGERLLAGFRYFLRVLLRTLIILAVLVLVGLALWFGLPFLYDKFIRPINVISQRQITFQATQEAANQQASARLATLEARNNADSTAVAALKSGLAEVESGLQAQATGDAANLDSALKRLDTIEKSLSALDSTASDASAAIKDQADQLSALATTVKAGSPEAAVLHREIEMVKVMEYLTRSRLFLSQNNIGLAQRELKAAQDVLAALQAVVPAYQAQAISDILARLDLAQGNLPASPVLAADDVEIAWQMVVNGLPGAPGTGTPEPSPVVPTSTLTPTP